MTDQDRLRDAFRAYMTSAKAAQRALDNMPFDLSYDLFYRSVTEPDVPLEDVFTELRQMIEETK